MDGLAGAESESPPAEGLVSVSFGLLGPVVSAGFALAYFPSSFSPGIGDFPLLPGLPTPDSSSDLLIFLI